MVKSDIWLLSDLEAAIFRSGIIEGSIAAAASTFTILAI